MGIPDQDELSAAAALHKRAMFKENAILLAGDGGSIESVQMRSGMASRQSDEQRKRREAKRRTASDDAIFLDLLNQRLAPIEATLEAKYGPDFIDQMAKKYLDDETYDRLAAIDDPEERKAAMREELARQHREGRIHITEVDIEDWLDAYDDAVSEARQQRDAVVRGEAVAKNASVAFTAAATGDATRQEQERDAERNLAQTASADFDENSDEALETAFDSFEL